MSQRAGCLVGTRRRRGHVRRRRLSGTGNWTCFLDLVDCWLRHEIRAALAGIPRGRYALGPSDGKATHCLLLDLQQRQVYVAELLPACTLLHGQHAEHLACLAELTSEEMWAAVERAMDTWHTQIATAPTAFTICPSGCSQGWKVVDDGYDRCETCGGRWLIPAQEAQLEAETA